MTSGNYQKRGNFKNGFDVSQRPLKFGVNIFKYIYIYI